MTSIAMKTIVLAGLATVLTAGSAQAQFAGGSSDTSKVTVGESDVQGGPHVAGRAGIGVPGTNGRRVDFQGLSLYAAADVNGVRHLNMATSDTADHSSYGDFRFARVGSADLWFGEWSQTGNATAGDHTVYYVGNTSGTTVPTSGTATYSVKGISDYANKGVLTGTLTANFASGSTGTLRGSLSNASTGAGVNIGTARINGADFAGGNAVATQSGATVASGGVVSGRFFGASAAALAGTIKFDGARQHDTAFGGTKN
ncbi:MAG TPA: Slam-dependent surface lipoprotein [Sphingomonas sanguinis]|uniref:Slam-dependent surface lipoprotein n=1 Tax=Sphingomonas sanguinis TaxID=33051 RepID=UPI002AC035E8|nr:Slam-dependent surface lipoprotein [Sphingomonas sanguinis]